MIRNKRITILVTEQEHKQIKIRAITKGTTITEWLKKAIDEYCEAEDKEEKE